MHAATQHSIHAALPPRNITVLSLPVNAKRLNPPAHPLLPVRPPTSCGNDGQWQVHERALNDHARRRYFPRKFRHACCGQTSKNNVLR